MTAPRTPPVFVLGMHRSGTSAITRSLNLLGLPLLHADRLLPPASDNPEGFWESQPMVDLDDRLLAALGGTMYHPPTPESEWADRADLGALRAEARALLAGAPAGWLWKDPRACVLLPFWRAVVDEPPLAVLVVRNPLAIAASLATREDLPTRHALAMWELYTRALLTDGAGLPALVVRYEDSVREPAAWLDTAEAFITRRGSLTATADRQRAHGAIKATLKHHAEDDEAFLADERVSDEQRELWRCSLLLLGEHDALPAAALPPPTPWLGQVLDDQRMPRDRILRLQRQLEGVGAEISRITLAWRSADEALRQREAQLAEAWRSLEQARVDLEAAQADLEELESLRHAVKRYRELTSRLVPYGSLRRKIANRTYVAVRSHLPRA